MRILFVLALTAGAAVAQSPVVQLSNITRPADKKFVIGDHFEIVITGAANQPVSVRTIATAGTDWGPVIGWTDSGGRWSIKGQRWKNDFGDWNEFWTVGGRMASPSIHLSVGAPCLKGGQSFALTSGPNIRLTCETAEGRQSFGTPSAAEPFRTPDGRIVPGRMRSDMTAEDYRTEIMEGLITGSHHAGSGLFGDEAALLISKILGANALTEDEARNVLSIIHDAFEKPDRIPQAAKYPVATRLLLQNLADSPDLKGLAPQILETMAYVNQR